MTVPKADVEAVCDLVRAREDARADLMRVQHRCQNCCCVTAGCIQMGRPGMAFTKPGCIGHVSTMLIPRQPLTTTSKPC